MECTKCGTKMYERTAKNITNSTKIYICPNCGAIIYVWPDGDVKESDEGSAYSPDEM